MFYLQTLYYRQLEGKESTETTEPVCFIDSNMRNDQMFGGVFDSRDVRVMKNGWKT